METASALPNLRLSLGKHFALTFAIIGYYAVVGVCTYLLSLASLVVIKPYKELQGVSLYAVE